METLNKLYDQDDIANAVSGADIDGDVWTEEEFSNLILDEESPPKKKLKRSPKSMASQFQTRLEKEMVKHVQKARENAAVHERAHQHKVPDHWNMSTETKREWLEPRVPRMGLSADGVPIVLHLPQIIHERGHDELYSALMEYGSVVPLQIGAGADKKKRDKEDAYHVVEGQLAGNTKLVTVWHAVGHKFSAGATLVHRLKLLNVRLNSALRVLDPPQYEAMLKFQVALQTKYAHVKAMDAIDGLLWEGRSLQYNRQTPLHPDSTDPPQAWVALVAFVLAFEDGQRVSIAHFTHQSLWEEMGIALPY
ncbi:hypothetical protein EDB19DRAFT_1833511 [Suillus lakei]|nr:hypothetical protein EDB19DRAFT_1833511 [Suillus lakei]